MNRNLITSALFILLLLAGASCGDDEGSASFTLEGTVWVEKSFSSTGCDDPADNESGTSSCNSNECSTLLLSNGAFTTTETDGGTTETTTGSYTITGNTVNITITDGGFSATFEVTFSISGNILTISFEDPTNGCFNSGTFEAQG